MIIKKKKKQEDYVVMIALKENYLPSTRFSNFSKYIFLFLFYMEST